MFKHVHLGVFIVTRLLTMISVQNKKAFQLNADCSLADIRGHIVHKFEHIWGHFMVGGAGLRRGGSL